MTVYRITRFTSPDVNKAVAMAEGAREEVAAHGGFLVATNEIISFLFQPLNDCVGHPKGRNKQYGNPPIH